MSIHTDAGNGNTAPPIPDIAGLTSLVATTLTADAELTADYTSLIANFGTGASPNIEEILSHLRALIDVVRDGDINGLTKSKLQALDMRICEITAGVVGVPLLGEGTPCHKLTAWMSSITKLHHFKTIGVLAYNRHFFY